MNQKPRVLVLLGNLALNGQERGNIEVYRALADDGVESLFVTNAAWGSRFIEPYLAGLGLASTPLAYARHFTRALSLVDTVRNVGRVLSGSVALWRVARAYRPTHIHVANPHYALCVLPALWALRVPVVYRMGDAPTLHAFYGPLWRWGIVPLVSRFVCISSYVAGEARDSGVPPDKITVALSAPPVRPPATTRVRPADSAASARVVFLGQVSAHKGVHLLVESAGLLRTDHPDLDVVVAGRLNDRAYGEALRALVEAKGLETCVRFVGYVDDVDTLLRSAAVHCAPSVWEEPLGNVVLEAKRAGVPSVVFPTGGLPELVVETGADGVVCTEVTAEALAVGLDHYLKMRPDERREAGGRATASLDHLGATEARVRRAWLGVLEETRVEGRR